MPLQSINELNLKYEGTSRLNTRCKQSETEGETRVFEDKHTDK